MLTMTELTTTEKEAVNILQDGPKTRKELYEELNNIQTPAEVSDVMRSLRYKGYAYFSFEEGFVLDSENEQ